MKHVVSFILKFVIVLVLLEIVLSLMTALTIGQIFVASAAVTLIAYVIADLLILPFSNNTVATLCEAILSFLTIYLFGYWMGYAFISIGAAITSAVVLSIAAWFFHKYMENAIYPHRRDRRRRNT